MLGAQKGLPGAIHRCDRETFIPADPRVRGINTFLDLDGLQYGIRSFYSQVGASLARS